MKKVLIAIVILLAVLAALQGIYMLLRDATQSRREPPTAATSQKIEAGKNNEAIGQNEAANIAVSSQAELTHNTHSVKVAGPSAINKQIENLDDVPEPTEPPRFEDLPQDVQQSYLDMEQELDDNLYARRFNMTVGEWKALTPKEQRILIRKGRRNE